MGIERIVTDGSSVWRLAQGFEALDGVAPSWRILAAHGSTAHAFDDYDFVRACARAVDPASILVAQAGHGGEGGILPLRIVCRYGLREAVSLASPIAQYATFIGERLCGATMADLAGLLRRHHGVDALRLRKVRGDSPLAKAMREAGVPAREETRAPCLDLSRFRTVEEFEASLSPSLRRTRRQRGRRLESAHGPLLFSVRPGAHAGEALDLALTWKRDWLRRSATTSSVLDAGPWEAALKACARTDGAVIGVLSAGNQPVAIELGFVHRRGYVAYLGAFDDAFARYSVGTEQIARCIGWCIEQGLASYDFLAPDDEYKRAWVRDESGVSVADYTMTMSARGRVISTVRGEARVVAKKAFVRLPRSVQAAAHRVGLTHDTDGILRWGGAGLTLATISATLVSCD